LRVFSGGKGLGGEGKGREGKEGKGESRESLPLVLELKKPTRKGN